MHHSVAETKDSRHELAGKFSDQRSALASRGQFTVVAHCCGLLLISHWSINPKGTRILGEKKVKRKRRVSLATNQSMTGQIVVVAAKTQARLQTKTTQATTSSREII